MKQFKLIFILIVILSSSCSQKDKKNQYDQKIENLVAFTKAYGYVKYFHPSDEASKIDWGKFAIYGAQEIENCNTTSEVIETLNRIFIPIAPSINFSDSENDFDLKAITPKDLKNHQPVFWQHIGLSLDMNFKNREYESRRVGRTNNSSGEQLFKQSLKFGEIIEQEIADSIFCQIPLVLYSDSINTYPKANPALFNELNSELENCLITPQYLAHRLGNIINVYNVFQHFYPYFDVVDVDWENELKIALLRCYSDKSVNDHLITLQKFTATLKDGHVSVFTSAEERYYYPPIAWEWIEHKLVITRVLDGVEDVKVGDIVTHINGQPSKEYFKEIHSRISAATTGWLNYRAESSSLFGKQNSAFTLTIKNKSIHLKRDRYSFDDNLIYYKNPEESRIIDDGIFYLNLDVIDMKSILKLLPDLKNSKAIICDLRGYPNGNHDLISYLLKSNDTTSAWMLIPQIVYPDQKKILKYAKHNWIETMKVKKPHLGDKKIVFIINGSAVSYAESFMGYIEGYKLAEIVGQPTAGTNGNTNPFDLPGEYRINWTGMKVVKHDGSQHHGIGILPNVYVNKTIKGIKEGRDEFLEKAIEIARQGSSELDL